MGITFRGFDYVAADDSLALTGSNSFTGTVNVAMPITDLQLTGTRGTPVPVKRELKVAFKNISFG